MTDLRPASSLPLFVENDGRLRMEAGLAAARSQARRCDELRPVLLDPAAAGSTEAYWMYRAVSLPADRERFQAAGVRYDITVIRPGTIGREYVKTAGHFHPVCPGSGLAYPEVYEVLHGTAHFLLQLTGDREDTVSEALLIEVPAGERLVIPPGYGHVAINASPGWLVTANLVADGFDNRYDPYVRAGGAVFYLVRSPGGLAYEPNPRLKAPAAPRRQDPRDLDLPGIEASDPIYALFRHSPQDFLFLREPDRINWNFVKCLGRRG